MKKALTYTLRIAAFVANIAVLLVCAAVVAATIGTGLYYSPVPLPFGLAAFVLAVVFGQAAFGYLRRFHLLDASDGERAERIAADKLKRLKEIEREYGKLHANGHFKT